MIFLFQYIFTHSDFLMLIEYSVHFIRNLDYTYSYLVSILTFFFALYNDALFMDAKIEFRETDPLR